MWSLYSAMILGLVAMPLALGCSGDDGGGTDCDGLQVDPVLSSIQSEVFTPRCAFIGCHGGGVPEAGLSLASADASYDSLVNVAAVTTTSDKILAIPGDPANSYLLNKLEGVGIESNATFPDTEAMPEGGSLCAVSIDAIRTWIADGCPR